MTADPLSLASLRSLPLKEQVVRELTRLIDDGVLPPSARLPSERSLAERLGVSRGTVREAVQFLEALGLVEVRHGSGTYVRAVGVHRADLRAEWRSWTRRHSAQVRDLLDVRRALEAHAAELAAQRASSVALVNLRDALEQMEYAANQRDVPLLVQTDVNFHNAIVEASGNVAMVELVNAVGSQLLPERAATWDSPGRPMRSVAEHRRIFAAIDGRNPPAARAAVLDHLASIERDVDLMVASGQAADGDGTPVSITQEKANRRTRDVS